MARRGDGTRTVARPQWVLLDDTEESVVGADRHQLAIGNLAGGLHAVARARPALACGQSADPVFDPRGEIVARQCRGWRWVEGALRAWPPAASGRYESALGVSFAPEDVLLRVYGPDGEPLPFDFEQAALLEDERAARLDSEQRAATEHRRADALDAELRRLRGR